MSDKVISIDERIRPAYVTDNETGAKYELDFNREAIRFAENRGFKLENVSDYPVTAAADLFYFSFRMHHAKVARDKTDKMIDKWGGGLPESLLGRLIQLYQQAMVPNVVVPDEEAEKNSSLTVEL